MEKHTRYKDQTAKEHNIEPRCISGFYACSSSHSKRERGLGGESHIYHDDVDLSIAVAQPKGVTTLALRSAEII